MKKRMIVPCVTVTLALVLAGGSGFVAWGQTKAKVEHLAERQDRIESVLENIRVTQTEHGAVLRGLLTQGDWLAQTQQQMLDTMTRLDNRLNDRRDSR